MQSEDDRRPTSPEELPTDPPGGDNLQSGGDPAAPEESTPAAIPYTSPADAGQPLYEDPYGYDPYASEPVPYAGAANPAAELARPPEPPSPPPPPADSEPDAEEEDEDGEGMLRMSFMEHLEELRIRIIRALMGLGVAAVLSMAFSEHLFDIVRAPAAAALKQLGYPPDLVTTSPMESFSIIWVKLPLLTGLFVASPWLLYQVWAFVSPGLYKKERRFAVPFIVCSAGLFISGALFAYFVAFRFGLTFLLGIGRDVGVVPMITITNYFDIFVNVILGIAVVFELPILIFFLTLLRIASPRFLIANARYAVLAIVVLAAIVTPTPDVINLMLFSVPMVLLFFIGVFARYLLVLKRENRRFPWTTFLLAVLVPLALIGAGVYLAVTRYGYRFVFEWPFLVR